MSNNPYAAPVAPIQIVRPVTDSLSLLLLRIDLFVSSAFALRAAIVVAVLSQAIFGEGSDQLGVQLRVLLMSDFWTGILELLAGFAFLGYDIHALLSKRRSLALLLMAHAILLLFLFLRHEMFLGDLFSPDSDLGRQRLFATWLPCIARLLYWPVCKLGYRSLQRVWPNASSQ